MWLTLLRIAGNPKVMLIVGVVLLAGMISWTLIRYGEQKEATRVILEKQETYITTRKKIDNATKDSPRDVDAARSWLRDRQADK